MLYYERIKFIDGFRKTLTGWGMNLEKTYSFKGKYLEEQKMFVFGIKDVDL